MKIKSLESVRRSSGPAGRTFQRRYHLTPGTASAPGREDIEELCQRVIIIDHGRIFFDGPLSAIIDRFATHKIVSLSFANG